MYTPMMWLFAAQKLCFDFRLSVVITLGQFLPFTND